MKFNEKLKYFVIGSLTSLLLVSGVSFGDDFLQTIQASFVDVVINGNNNSVPTKILTYEKTLYVPLFDIADATGLKLENSKDSDAIEFSNYEIVAKIPTGLKYSQSDNNIFINWDNTGADYYVIATKNYNQDEFIPILDSSGNLKHFKWYSDYSLKYTPSVIGKPIQFIVTSVKNGNYSADSIPLIANTSATTNKSATSTIIKSSNSQPSIERTTFEILMLNYSTDNILKSIISSDKISIAADKNLSNQNKWLRVFDSTLADKSSNTGGRTNSAAVSAALTAANNSVK